MLFGDLKLGLIIKIDTDIFMYRLLWLKSSSLTMIYRSWLSTKIVTDHRLLSREETQKLVSYCIYGRKNIFTGKSIT